MLFQLLRDVIELRALDCLTIDNVGNNGLIFPGEVLIQQLDHSLAIDFVFFLHTASIA